MSSTAVDAPATATKTVVVADDTAFVRDRFKTALERAGHTTITVANGSELVSRVKTSAAGIDLIVVDLRLPQANGVNIVRALRAIDPQRPPIVVFSGTIANAGEVRELAALNVGGYVNEYTALQHIMPSLSPHLFPGDFNRRTGPRVVLGIPIAKRDIDVESKVAWSNKRVGMGLEFLALSAQDQQAIAEYVDSHFFSNRKA